MPSDHSVISNECTVYACQAQKTMTIINQKRLDYGGVQCEQYVPSFPLLRCAVQYLTLICCDCTFKTNYF